MVLSVRGNMFNICISKSHRTTVYKEEVTGNEFCSNNGLFPVPSVCPTHQVAAP